MGSSTQRDDGVFVPSRYRIRKVVNGLNEVYFYPEKWRVGDNGYCWEALSWFGCFGACSLTTTLGDALHQIELNKRHERENILRCQLTETIIEV